MNSYTINGHHLLPHQRKLCGPDGEQSIRPKTLALLLYLIENKHTISSKQVLLDNVWDDVHVNDGVVFQ